MNIKEIEEIVIHCIEDNLRMSGDPVPSINGGTRPFTDLAGFDSLRTIETLLGIEDKVGCDLPHEKIVINKNFKDVTISSMAIAIKNIVEN